MLKSITIKNFRSLKDFHMEFNQGLNVIIGENDSGKTSLLDSLMILFNKKRIDINDFNDADEAITISLEDADYTYLLESRIKDDEVSSIYKIKASEEKYNKIKSQLNSSKFNELDESKQFNLLRKYYSIFNLSFKPSSDINILKENLLALIEKQDFICVKSIDFPISFLGSRDFENLSYFFENTFFKELKEDVWKHKVEGKTINHHIGDYIESFKNEQLDNENTEKLNAQLQEFIPDFKEINPIVHYEPELNIHVDVELLDVNNQPMVPEKMGDGTNRRTAMTLFKYKKDKNDLVYVFDEIETHLHVKTQLDILRLLKELVKEGKQIIITTHSQFLINQVNLNDIKLIIHDKDGSKVHTLESNHETQVELANLGLMNMDLFFTSKLLIVEGESELKFIPMMYEKIYGYPITHNFIKIVKADGIKDIPTFIRVIKKSFAKTDIFVLMDNDADFDTKERINKLIEHDLVHKENIFTIGKKEFEDTFPNEIVAEALSQYISDKIGHESKVSVEEIERIRDSRKFSKSLGSIFYDKTERNFKKPIFAEYLAIYAEKEDIDKKFIKLFELISD